MWCSPLALAHEKATFGSIYYHALFQQIGTGQVRFCGGCNFIHQPAWKSRGNLTKKKVLPQKDSLQWTLSLRRVLLPKASDKADWCGKEIGQREALRQSPEEICTYSNQWGFLIRWELTINWRGCAETSIKPLDVSTHLQFIRGAPRPIYCWITKIKIQINLKSRLSKLIAFGIGNKLTVIKAKTPNLYLFPASGPPTP